MDNQPNLSTSPYAAIIQQLDDAVIVLDSETCITLLNPAARKLFQSSDNSIIGQTFSTVMQQRLHVDISLETIGDTLLDCQVDQQQRFYKLTHNILSEDNGSFIVLSDVTLQYTIANELSRLQSKYSNYAHTVAHDVKSPLGVAIGYANMLQDDLPDDSEAHIFADEIFATSMRIMYICNELVVLAELGENKATELAPVNLHTAIETSLRRFQKDIQNADISLNIPQTIPFVMSNLPWIEEVMVNVFKHMIYASGSVTRISLETTEAAGRLKVLVQHDGEPLIQADQDTLFDRNRGIDDIRAEGDGLGMDIAKQLIERLDGEIGVADNYTLYLTLPIVDFSKK